MKLYDMRGPVRGPPPVQSYLGRCPWRALLAACLLNPLGLWRRRADLLVAQARAWTAARWKVLSDLPGAGPYALDAIETFCLGVPSATSADGVLTTWAADVLGRSLDA